jgi:RES domain-containing protein
MVRPYRIRRCAAGPGRDYGGDPGACVASFHPANRLPKNWRHFPAPAELARFGDEFVRAARAAILIVPSALAPAESNWLIHPKHPDFARIQVRPPERFEYDSRFFKV